MYIYEDNVLKTVSKWLKIPEKALGIKNLRKGSWSIVVKANGKYHSLGRFFSKRRFFKPTKLALALNAERNA